MGLDDDVFAVMVHLDRLLSAKDFAEVDDFIDHIDVRDIKDAAYLLAVYSYIVIAERVGDILHSGQSYKERARVRLIEMVGEERTERLLQFRVL